MNKLYSNADIERLHPHKFARDKKDLRSEFQHDRDRIIHSEAFRRLQNKTQVLFPGEYDFYRTRLTHSIETAQLGRTIAYHLNQSDPALKKNDFQIDYDLVEAICLSHDIGHSPFGHLGERVLNQIMAGPTNKNLPDYLISQYKHLLETVKKEVSEFNDPGFEGNAQNLRIVESLAYSNGFEGRFGFNPSIAFWEGLIKYPYTATEAAKKNSNKFIYNSTFGIYQKYQQQFFDHSIETYQKYNFSSIENQIMEKADDISYSILDIEDAYNSRFIGMKNLDRIQDFIRSNVDIQTLKKTNILEEFQTSLRSKQDLRQFKNRFITRFVTDLKLELALNMSDITKSNRKSRFDYSLKFNNRDYSLIIQLFKDLVREFVFTTPHIKQLQHSLPFYLLKMFQAYYFHPELLPRETQSELPENLSQKRINEIKRNKQIMWSKSRIICDHISGMTDNYFLKQYKKLFKAGESHLMDIL